jgi:SEC-C motif
MKTGRNDPCPCGSGKKYKKCCLEKDQQRMAAEPLRGVSPRHRPDDSFNPSPPPHPSYPVRPLQPPPPEPTPWDDLWERFNKAPNEDKINLFLATLDDKELMDEDVAADMIGTIESAMITAGRRERMEEIVEQMRQRRPDLYLDLVPSLAEMRIVTALLANRPDEVRRLGLELAEVGHENPELYHSVLKCLAYHGQLALLVEMLHVSWPKLKENDDLLAWELNEYAYTGAVYEMFTEVDRDPAATTISPSLRERLHCYFEAPNEASIENLWKRITRQTNQVWSMSDFEFARRPTKRDTYDNDDETDEDDEPELWHDPARDRLWDLTVTFLVEARRQGTVSWTRGELARQELMRYLLKRFDSELEPRPGLLEKSRQKQPKAPARPANLLCPDEATLQQFFVDLLHPLSMSTYQVAATFELVPAWLRFLESRQLLSSELHQQTLKAMEPIRASLAKLWANKLDEPSFSQELVRAWEGVK